MESNILDVIEMMRISLKCTREEYIEALKKEKGIYMNASKRILREKKLKSKESHNDGHGHYISSPETYYKDKNCTIECDSFFNEYEGENIFGTLHGDNA